MVRNSYFLVETDRWLHIRAMGHGGAPYAERNQMFHEVLSCWRPEPAVWTQPALVASLARKAVDSAPTLDAATKEWFRAASLADRLALVYDQRNDPADRPSAGRELVEAWLLHRAATQEATTRGKTLTWPAPQLAREAGAAQRPVLHEAVAGRCPAAYVPLLLTAGEDLAARDAQGATALHWAAAVRTDDEDHGSVAQALLDAGADTEAGEKWQGCTPLVIALCLQNAPVVRALMGAGAHASYRQWRLIRQIARELGWREVEEWQCRREARSLARVLGQPKKNRPVVQLRL